MLTKTRKILTLRSEIRMPDGTGAATFDDGERGVPFLRLSGQQFDDLGRPETVTVTIEPGDLLNTE